jgi:hypothetical protein
MYTVTRSVYIIRGLRELSNVCFFWPFWPRKRNGGVLKQSCGNSQGKEPVSCGLGCISARCCEVSNNGMDSHLCLSQLDKRLKREPEESDKCGGCGKVW